MNTEQNYVGRGNSATPTELTVAKDRIDALYKWAGTWSKYFSRSRPFLSPQQRKTLRAVFLRTLTHYGNYEFDESLSAEHFTWLVDLAYQTHATYCEAINAYLQEQKITQLTFTPLSYE